MPRWWPAPCWSLALQGFVTNVIASKQWLPGSSPSTRIDWSTGILQLVLGGAVGFVLPDNWA